MSKVCFLNDEKYRVQEGVSLKIISDSEAFEFWSEAEFLARNTPNSFVITVRQNGDFVGEIPMDDIKRDNIPMADIPTYLTKRVEEMTGTTDVVLVIL
jgi:hypothetical protein